MRPLRKFDIILHTHIQQCVNTLVKLHIHADCNCLQCLHIRCEMRFNWRCQLQVQPIKYFIACQKVGVSP
jgi:hypothetical protein